MPANRTLSRLFIHSFIFSVLVLSGCSSLVKPDSSQDYYEDLSVLRPSFIVEEDDTLNIPPSIPPAPQDILFDPVSDITYSLDSLLDSVAVYNQGKETIQGYTIQVYTGNSSTEANEVKMMVYRILPGSTPTVNYDLPNYKVKVGKFYHRMQALKDFSVIKDTYPNAILVPQKFRIE